MHLPAFLISSQEISSSFFSGSSQRSPPYLGMGLSQNLTRFTFLPEFSRRHCSALRIFQSLQPPDSIEIKVLSIIHSKHQFLIKLVNAYEIPGNVTWLIPWRSTTSGVIPSSDTTIIMATFQIAHTM